jgi:pSer/pThr/pTyr-binding forkhead associated (FHA) protein
VTYRGPDGRPLVHALRTSPVTIGRSSSADVCLWWDGQVSRMHARLELVGDDPANDWTVVDDGSSRNGSYVNGERIRGRAHLREGDGLSVGQTLLLFRVGAADGGGADASPRLQQTQGGATVYGLSRVTRDSLSTSQFRVLQALARPMDESDPSAEPASDEEIAAALFLNPDTVRAHLLLLYERFGVATLPPEQRRPALVTMARAGGLLLGERER